MATDKPTIPFRPAKGKKEHWEQIAKEKGYKRFNAFLEEMVEAGIKAIYGDITPALVVDPNQITIDDVLADDPPVGIDDGLVPAFFGESVLHVLDEYGIDSLCGFETIGSKSIVPMTIEAFSEYAHACAFCENKLPVQNIEHEPEFIVEVPVATLGQKVISPIDQLISPDEITVVWKKKGKKHIFHQVLDIPSTHCNCSSDVRHMSGWEFETYTVEQVRSLRNELCSVCAKQFDYEHPRQ